MESHLKAIGIKFIIVSTVILSLFGIFYTVTFGYLLFMCLAITGISYGVGDLFIYPKLGNLRTTLIDSVMYFSIVWLLSFMIIGVSTSLLIATLAATYFLTIAEPLFHTYMKERVYKIEDVQSLDHFQMGELQMEASEEIDDPTLRRESKDEETKE